MDVRISEQVAIESRTEADKLRDVFTRESMFHVTTQQLVFLNYVSNKTNCIQINIFLAFCSGGKLKGKDIKHLSKVLKLV